MAAPQGLFQFAGAQALFSGSFTLATGISPSVCTLSVAPGARSLRIGPLVLSYGGVRMVWRDCIVDKVEASIGEDGFTTWQLSILDRRWKWRGLGRISGKYNTRVGGTIDDTTRKSARQLVDLCLKELRERNAVTAEVPTDIFPEVEWDYEPPAEAMAKLCDELGLVVVLDVTDRVRVMRKGSGPSLPNLPSVVAYESLVDPPELPSGSGTRIRRNDQADRRAIVQTSRRLGVCRSAVVLQCGRRVSGACAADGVQVVQNC